ncbi:hypothetical protein ABZS61_00745 [Streptomyces sp. NPDC005566]
MSVIGRSGTQLRLSRARVLSADDVPADVFRRADGHTLGTHLSREQGVW